MPALPRRAFPSLLRFEGQNAYLLCSPVGGATVHQNRTIVLKEAEEIASKVKVAFVIALGLTFALIAAFGSSEFNIAQVLAAGVVGALGGLMLGGITEPPVCSSVNTLLKRKYDLELVTVYHDRDAQAQCHVA